MKFLGAETQVEVITKSVRKVEYIRCDKCGKKILPCGYRGGNSGYVHIHTWHSDWGNDSIESHRHTDCCKECAKQVIADYIDDMNGTEELEFSYEYVCKDESVTDFDEFDDGYALVEKDRGE